MDTLFYIILSTFIVSLISFVGALTLVLKENILNKILLFLVTFSAGALMGAAFLDLIPEAVEMVGINKENLVLVFVYVLLGFCAFFVMEQFIKWHHHHSLHHPEIKPFSYLILVSDAMHNFMDGLIIAASFATNFHLGVAATLAVIFHEIPHELGNFGVLIYGGFKKMTALLLNFLSAIVAILGGIIGFFLVDFIGSTFFLLAFAAGNFIYIAASDLVPEIKEESNWRKSIVHFFLFLCGIGFMYIFR